MKTVFELETVRIIGERYPIRKAYRSRIGLFSKKVSAEKALQQYVELNNKRPDDEKERFFGYFISEWVLDKIDDDCLYICSYTADGKFNDENMMDRHRKFHGRNVEKIRFKIGDIVEVCGCDNVELCIVAALPPTIEMYNNIKVKAEASLSKRGCKNYQFEMDDSDDQYMVYPLRGDYHMHIRSESVFYPTKKVSNRMQEELQRQLKNPNM